MSNFLNNFSLPTLSFPNSNNNTWSPIKNIKNVIAFKERTGETLDGSGRGRAAGSEDTCAKRMHVCPRMHPAHIFNKTRTFFGKLLKLGREDDAEARGKRIIAGRFYLATKVDEFFRSDEEK